MKNYLLLAIAAFFLVNSSCRRNHVPSMAEEKTAGHKIIAVLPVEMIFTGTRPKNVTEEDIIKIEETESKTFQQFLHDNILRNGNTDRYMLMVGVQNYINTIAMLSEHKISIRDSWYKTDEELARLLNVDAVVRMKVQKKRYMSDAASMGIDYGRQVIGAVLNKNVYVPNKTNDILASCSIISKGETLWNDNYRSASDWDTQPENVINNITRNFASHIPYRKRR
ncbi:MAG: hypothetical protein IPL50_09575 [Chitinophagaceae bacterium]|nr:hypothetical protein [Chitinophagaceae bacterium]